MRFLAPALASYQGKLENRIALASLAITMAMVALFGAVAYNSSFDLLQQNISTTIDREIDTSARKLELELNRLYRESNSLASNSMTANALVDSQGRDAYLQPFLRGHWIAADLGLTLALCDFQAKELIVSPKGAGRPCSKLPRFTDILDSAKPQSRIDASATPPRLIVGHPVLYPATGQVEGVLVVEGPLSTLVQQAGLDLPPGLSFMLADAAGVPILGERGKAPRNGDPPRIRRLDLAQPLAGLGLQLQLLVDSGTLHRPLRRLASMYAVLGILVTLVVTGLSRVVARRIAQPVRSLADAANRVGEDIRADVTLQVAGSDEAARLARAFDRMLNRLKGAYDLLELRVAERTSELRDAQRRLSSVLNSITDVVFSVSLDARTLLYVGPAVADVLGVSAEQLCTEPQLWESCFESAERARLRRLFARARRRGAAEAEVRILPRTTPVTWVQLRLHLVRDEEGAPLRVDGVARDITREKLAEIALSERTARLDAIFDLSPDGFVSFDPHGHVAYSNPAFSRMTSLEQADVHGLDIAAFDHMIGARCRPQQPYTQLLELENEHPRRGTEGVIRHLIRVASPAIKVLERSVRIGPSGWPELILYFRDVTRETEVDRMKSEFLSTAAHELRTPMASIYGFSELLLKRSYDESTRRDVLQTINRQAKILTNLVNELLDLARIEARAGKDFKRKVQGLAPIIEATLASLLVPDDPRKVEVRVPERLPPVNIDAEKFEQALTNVLSNAYKYSAGCGAIILTTRMRERAGRAEVGVVVRDHGIGMTPEQLARAFERFYRADTAGSVPGTGLGLSLVREIMKIHEGSVEIDSAVAQGTTVTLWLPAERSNRGHADVQRPEAA